MNADELIKRLRNALVKKSLRAVAKECDVSHELVRKLAHGKNSANLTLNTYTKISEGLH